MHNSSKDTNRVASRANMACVDCHFLSRTSWSTLAFWDCFELLDSSSSWGKATPSVSCSGPLSSLLRFGPLISALLRCLTLMPEMQKVQKKSARKVKHMLFTASKLKELYFFAPLVFLLLLLFCSTCYAFLSIYEHFYYSSNSMWHLLRWVTVITCLKILSKHELVLFIIPDIWCSDTVNVVNWWWLLFHSLFLLSCWGFEWDIRL